MRDYACVGYTTGISLHDLTEDPISIDFSKHCIISYDLECEYKGPGTSSIETPILCSSIYCSCGYNMTVSRANLGPTINHIVVSNNEQMAANVISLIKCHIFSAEEFRHDCEEKR
jgi:hypothetical protein